MSNLKELLKDTYSKQCFCMSNGDIEGVIDTIHPSSSTYSHTAKSIESVFKSYELSIEVMGLAVLGNDSTFAYTKARTKTIKESGPEFTDNITDSLVVFRQDGNDWKVWTQAILEVKPITEK